MEIKSNKPVEFLCPDPANNFTFCTHNKKRFTLSVSNEGVMDVELHDGTTLTEGAEAFLEAVEMLCGNTIEHRPLDKETEG
jgi:hypothetical protein